MKKNFVEKIHYYLENGKVIFTEQYHIDRGFCCGNGCRHCAFQPTHIKGSNDIKNVNNTTTNSGVSDT